MTINTETKKLIRATEKTRYLELEFEGKNCTGFDSNMPYEKSIEDFEFYGKAILQILKKI